MLGYIRCDEGELKGKHLALYRAVYCGLCHCVRVNRAYALLPFFSYDFVFLALVKMLIKKEEMAIERDFCLLHPFRKKKKRLKNNKTLEECVFSALVLTAEKMKDDLADPDSSWRRRLLIRLLLPFFERSKTRMKRGESARCELETEVAAKLRQGLEGEKRGATLDEMCSFFAEAMSLVFAYGHEGADRRLMEGLGDKIGRFLYTVDALDDLSSDLESGSFNPLISKGKMPDRKELSRLDMVLSFYVDEMKKILFLMEGDGNLFALCENVICCGLPAAMAKALKPENGEMK